MTRSCVESVEGMEADIGSGLPEPAVSRRSRRRHKNSIVLINKLLEGLDTRKNYPSVIQGLHTFVPASAQQKYDHGRRLPSRILPSLHSGDKIGGNWNRKG